MKTSFHIVYHWSDEYGSYDEWTEERSAESLESVKADIEDYLKREHNEVGLHCDGITIDVYVKYTRVACGKYEDEETEWLSEDRW